MDREAMKTFLLVSLNNENMEIISEGLFEVRGTELF